MIVTCILQIEINFGSWTLQVLCAKVKLEEDLELAGFVPLLGLPQDTVAQGDEQKQKQELCDHDLGEERIEAIKDRKRIDKLCLFAEYLCGLEQPYLRYDVISGCYKPVSRAFQQSEMEVGLKRMSAVR